MERKIRDFTKDTHFVLSFECILKHFLTLKPKLALFFFCLCLKSAASDFPVFCIAVIFDKDLKFSC